MPLSDAERCPTCGGSLEPIGGVAVCPLCSLGPGTRTGNPATGSRAERVFERSLGLGGEERRAFVAAACADAPGLLAEVEAILAGFEEAQAGSTGGEDGDDTFSPAGGDEEESGSGRRPREAPGARVGPYTLVEEIGRGGMGAVWLARQSEPFEREVALKVIKLGMDTDEVLRRFATERQVLAHLEHPNIARVYEAGATDAGRPYFAMERIDGAPITTYCISRDLPVEARLEVFLAVCAAVRHAHQRGIIHRDLKPSNVLVREVDGAPVPTVIDFGVAKATVAGGGEGDGRTLLTRVGQLVGTPSYMSPEQAAGDPAGVDTRTDIYALGAILYELLAGVAPFEPRRFKSLPASTVARILAEEEPSRPSTRLRQLRAAGEGPGGDGGGEGAGGFVAPGFGSDLDWIALKAMAKDPERRYGDVAALAEDVRRHLAHEPISAAAPTMAYRLGRFVRRNRLALATFSSISLAVLAGSGVAVWQAVRANRHAASEAEARVETAALLADSYTAFGIRADEDGDPLAAALWFAQAAAAAPDEARARREANRLRSAAWLRGAPRPLRVLRSSFPYGRRVEFHPVPMQPYLIALRETRNVDDPRTAADVFDVQRSRRLTFGEDLKKPWKTFTAAAFHPERAEVAVSPGPGRVHVYRLPGGDRLRELTFDDDERLSCLAYSRDGERLFAAARAGRVWRLSDGRELARLRAHPEQVLHADFNPGGTRLLTLTQGGELRWFRLPSPAVAGGDPAGAPPPPLMPDFPPLQQFNRAFLAPARFMDEDTFISRHEQDYYHWVDAASGATAFRGHLFNSPAPLAHLEADPLRVRDGEGPRLEPIPNSGEDMAVLPPRGLILTAERRPRLIHYAGRREATPLGPHYELVHSAAFSPDGLLAATVQFGGLVRVWNLHPDLTAYGAETSALGVVISPGSTYAVEAGSPLRDEFDKPPPGTDPIRVIRLADGAATGEAIQLDGQLIASAFSPDEATVAFAVGRAFADRSPETMLAPGGAAGDVVFWDWRTGRRRGTAEPMPSEPRSLYYHRRAPGPGGELIVLCAGGELLAVDDRTGSVEVLARLPAATTVPAQMHHRAGFLTPSQDGTRLYIWGLGQEYVAWDTGLSPTLRWQPESPCSSRTRDRCWAGSAATASSSSTRRPGIISRPVPPSSTGRTSSERLSRRMDRAC